MTQWKLVPVAADELIARLEASRAQWRDARGVPTDLESEAAAALRASAERERKLVEALEACEPFVAHFKGAWSNQTHGQISTDELLDTIRAALSTEPRP